MDSHLSADQAIQRFFKETKVSAIMMTPVRKVNVEDSLSKAEEMFTLYGISHLPVVDKKDKVVGILSHKYLYKIQSPRRFVGPEQDVSIDAIIDGDSYYWKETLDQFILANVMNSNHPIMNTDENVAQALMIMSQRKVGCISIVDDQNKLCGILTNQEIVNFITRALEQK